MYDIYICIPQSNIFSSLLHVIILHYKDRVKMTNYLTYVKKKDKYNFKTYITLCEIKFIAR